jgi:hypothetical protein
MPLIGEMSTRIGGVRMSGSFKVPFPEYGEWNWLVGRLVTIRQADAPIADVMPMPELETDIFIDTNRLEPCQFVKADTADVRQNDFGERRPEPLLP